MFVDFELNDGEPCGTPKNRSWVLIKENNNFLYENIWKGSIKETIFEAKLYSA